MKKSFTFLVVMFTIVLLAGNAMLFARSLNLEDEILHMEEQTKQLQTENVGLQVELSQLTSLTYIEDLADRLDFISTNAVSYLEEPAYALAPRE